MSYFVIIKEYANGELKKLGKYDGEWKNEVLFDVVKKHRLYRGKWWVVEVHDNGSVWLLKYDGRICNISEFVEFYSGWSVERLVKMIQMAKEDGDDS